MVEHIKVTDKRASASVPPAHEVLQGGTGTVITPSEARARDTMSPEPTDRDPFVHQHSVDPPVVADEPDAED